MGSGTQFDYIISKVGDYNYHCDVHFSLGMTGAFTAIPSPMIERSAVQTGANLQVQDIYPNPAVLSPVRIVYTVPAAQRVTLAIYNMQGAKVATLAQGKRSQGEYRVDLVPNALPSGTYIARLTGVHQSANRSFFIVR